MIRPTGGELHERSGRGGLVDVPVKPPLGEGELIKRDDGVVLVQAGRVPATHT